MNGCHLWPKLPKYWSLGQPSDAAVNSAGEIFVVSRGDHPVSIWTLEGDFLGSWGEGIFSAMPHGIYIGRDDNVWIVDRDHHVAMEFTPEGKPLRTLGQKLSPSPTCTGKVVRARPFNMPTNLAIARNGDIFVADGYGNSKVHRFGADGRLTLSWGRQGDGPGEFALVHNVWIDSRDRVLICDDENDRLQIFDQEEISLSSDIRQSERTVRAWRRCLHRSIATVSRGLWRAGARERRDLYSRRPTPYAVGRHGGRDSRRAAGSARSLRRQGWKHLCLRSAGASDL